MFWIKVQNICRLVHSLNQFAPKYMSSNNRPFEGPKTNRSEDSRTKIECMGKVSDKAKIESVEDIQPIKITDVTFSGKNKGVGIVASDLKSDELYKRVEEFVKRKKLFEVNSKGESRLMSKTKFILENVEKDYPNFASLGKLDMGFIDNLKAMNDEIRAKVDSYELAFNALYETPSFMENVTPEMLEEISSIRSMARQINAEYSVKSRSLIREHKEAMDALRNDRDEKLELNYSMSKEAQVDAIGIKDLCLGAQVRIAKVQSFFDNASSEEVKEIIDKGVNPQSIKDFTIAEYKKTIYGLVYDGTFASVKRALYAMRSDFTMAVSMIELNRYGSQ